MNETRPAVWTPHYDDKSMREEGPPLTFDNTMRGTFRSCPRKFYWFWRGLDYATTPPYFTFGRAWQAILDKWYTPQVTQSMSPTEIYAKMEDALEAGRQVWAEDGAIGSGVNTIENLEELFKHYVGTYPVEPFVVVGAEKGWEWPIAGTPYFLGGSLDDYVQWQPYGYLIMENKTSGVYLNDQYIRGWSFAQQVSQYIWYLTQLKGDEVFGCLMNMACKRIPKKKTPDALFARNLETRDPFELEEFIESTLLDIKDIEREWERWKWQKTVNQIECVGGIGKSPCLFQGLCQAKAKPWELDPLAYAGIKWREEKWEPWLRE